MLVLLSGVILVPIAVLVKLLRDETESTTGCKKCQTQPKYLLRDKLTDSKDQRPEDDVPDALASASSTTNIRVVGALFRRSCDYL